MLADVCYLAPFMSWVPGPTIVRELDTLCRVEVSKISKYFVQNFRRKLHYCRVRITLVVEVSDALAVLENEFLQPCFQFPDLTLYLILYKVDVACFLSNCLVDENLFIRIQDNVAFKAGHDNGVCENETETILFRLELGCIRVWQL